MSHHAAELHRASIVIDTHCDTLIPVLQGTRKLGGSTPPAKGDGHIDLPRLEQGGVTAQTFAIYHAWRTLRQRSLKKALRSIDAFYQGIEQNSDRLLQVTHAADIREAKRQGKVGAILSLEGVEPIGGDVRVLRTLHRLGLRMIGLTWNYRNAAADGVGITYAQRGLSKIGHALVEEMMRLGIVVDIAHLAPPGVEDVLRLAEVPIIDSHTAARTLCDHVRNLTDAQIEGVAATGGVICVTFVPNFLAADGQASLERYLDHLEHCIRVAGIDHVGLGSDFDGYGGTTVGMEDASHWPAITAGLVVRGHSDEAIQKVLGLNLLRVFEQVWT